MYIVARITPIEKEGNAQHLKLITSPRNKHTIFVFYFIFQ